MGPVMSKSNLWARLIDTLADSVPPPTDSLWEVCTTKAPIGEAPDAATKTTRGPVPPLSGWHAQPQTSDQLASSARFPAVVHIDGSDSLYGSVASDSSVHFTPSLVTMFPTIGVTIRQNFLTGNEKQKMQRMRKEARENGEKPPLLTKYGFDHEGHAADHIQESFEWAFEALEDFECRQMTEEDAALMFPSGKAKSPVMIVEFGVEEHPCHSHRHGLNAWFSPQSPQANLASRVKAATRVTIAFSIDKYLNARFAEWRNINLLARLYSPYPEGTDDWYPSRHPLYDFDSPKSYQQIINSDIPLELPPWLLRVKDGVLTYASAYSIVNGIPRAQWPTMQSVAQHYLPALLWERQEAYRVECEVYNTSIKYPATARVIDSGHVKFDVHLANAALKSLPKSAIPRADTEVSVFVETISDLVSPIEQGNGDSAFIGSLCASTAAGFDMSIDAKVPQTIGPGVASNPIVDGNTYNVYLLCAAFDFTAKARMNAVEEAAASRSAVAKKSELVHGKQRGTFDIDSIFCDTTDGHWSPSYAADWLAKQSTLETANPATAELVQELQTRDMTVEQQDCLGYILHGAFCNTLKLQGFPGSGKTTTLARAVVILMLMGNKVMMVSQSNQGVDALFDAVKKLIDTWPGLSKLKEKIARLRNELAEMRLALHLRSGLPDHHNEFTETNRQVAHLLHEYCLANPTDELVLAYQDQLRVKSEKKDTQERRSKMSSARNALRRMVLEPCTALACTSYAASNINRATFEADVLIFDEAGQATDPDIMAALSKQKRYLGLLVIAGDPRQLPPVVVSETSQRNPLGNFLAVSALERLCAPEWSEIPLVQLTINFRSHPSIVAMPSLINYENKMTAGIAATDPFWDTTLSRNVHKVLRGRVFARAIDPDTARSNNRQYFMNVETMAEKEELGTSYYNEGGINAIIKLISMLLAGGVQEKHIGIITMYKADLRILKERLRHLGLNILASSVNGYQGQEKEIIILHFVATRNTRGKLTDPFGFVKNRQCLCVATTRARQFSFMVGNGKYWRQYFNSPRDTNLGRCTAIRGVLDWVEQKKQVIQWRQVYGSRN